MSMQDTKKVERRQLRFESIDEVLVEVDRIVAASHAGTLKAQGNWTAGQILAHLAAWIEYGYNGFPMKPLPWIVRSILRLTLPGMLKKGMRPGVMIPGISAGTTGQDDMPIDAAADRLRRALARLAAGEECPHDSPAFGKLSHDDRIRLNLRHCELHLSFLS